MVHITSFDNSYESAYGLVDTLKFYGKITGWRKTLKMVLQFRVEFASPSINPRIFNNFIFHGIDTYGHRKPRASTGFSRLIDNRVGVEESDNLWMQRALALAGRAAAKDEVPVGALVVKDDEVIGEGWNCPISTNDPTAHAEIVALRDAAERIGNYRLSGATLIVTLEPCLMCAGAMVHARIDRLVFGARDSKRGAVNSTLHAFDTDGLNHRVVVSGGVMEEDCARLLRGFFQKRRN